MKKTFIAYSVCACLFSCTSPDTTSVNDTPGKFSKQADTNYVVPEKITFPSIDSLPVVANLYHKNELAPVIVLCHQAGFNKFEYTGIARTLWEKGFNCLAIDQRSGGGLIEEFNETQQEALKRKLATDFLDAEQDLIAAVKFASEKYKKPVILWGSSYSSTLALHVAIAREEVRAVIAFSPGDYFEKEKGLLRTKLQTFSKPMFVTSSREEAKELTEMLSKMKMTAHQVQFIPDSAGHHGSRALWRTSGNNEEYWKAIDVFLGKVK